MEEAEEVKVGEEEVGWMMISGLMIQVGGIKVFPHSPHRSSHTHIVSSPPPTLPAATIESFPSTEYPATE
jgi:hypothetical protein